MVVHVFFPYMEIHFLYFYLVDLYQVLCSYLNIQMLRASCNVCFDPQIVIVV